MFFIGSDFTEGDGDFATFAARMKSGGNGKVLVEVYCTSGMVAASPYVVGYLYTTESAGALWLQPQAMATNPMRGLVGVASDVVSSGCNGWIQIRGLIGSVSFGVASQTGSMGDSVFWASANGLKATGSTYIGAAVQVGIIADGAGMESGTNTASILLVGNAYAESI